MALCYRTEPGMLDDVIARDQLASRARRSPASNPSPEISILYALDAPEDVMPSNPVAETIISTLDKQEAQARRNVDRAALPNGDGPRCSCGDQHRVGPRRRSSYVRRLRDALAEHINRPADCAVGRTRIESALASFGDGSLDPREHHLTARARSCGTSPRRCSIGVGRSEICLTSIAGVLVAVNGGSPQSIWYATTPSE